MESTYTHFKPFLFVFLAGVVFMGGFAVWILRCTHRAWCDVAKQLGSEMQFDGSLQRVGWGQIERSDYTNCLKVGTNEQGLCLDLWHLPWIKLPRIMIPWQKISLIKRQQHYMGDMALVEIGTEKVLTIRVPWEYIERSREWISVDHFREL